MRSARNFQETTQGRAVLVSILGGFTLFALAITVFAVASQARSVSVQAEESVRIIEDLRVVSIARAELSIASRIDAIAPDQRILVEASIDNANEAVEAVFENFDENTSATIIDAFTQYRAAATDQGALILDESTSSNEAVAAELRTGEAFERMSSVMRAEQILALDGLRSDNDLMNVIGTIATFVVAFVVPSAALYVFEALRRTPRRARALELEHERAIATAQAMAAAVAKEARQLRAILADLPDTVDSDDLQRSILRFEHIAELNGAIRRRLSVDIDVDELVASTVGQVASTIDSEITITKASSDPGTLVHGDRDQLTLVIVELLHNAVRHGAAPVTIGVSADNDNISIAVNDNGSGLPDVVEDAVIHDNEYATRGNLLSGSYGFGLLAAREATESLGGSLDYRRERTQTSLIVILPKPNRPAVEEASGRSHDVADLPARAA